MKMKATQTALTRGLPKTGQTNQKQPGDDGAHQSGWWLGKTGANNKTRFVAKTLAGDDVVIDRATGLMGAADGNAAGCNNGGQLSWLAALNYANGLDFAGFGDWYLPNLTQLLSIVDYSRRLPAIYTAFFPSTQNLNYYTATACESSATRRWIVHFDLGDSYFIEFPVLCYLRCVRGGL